MCVHYDFMTLSMRDAIKYVAIHNPRVKQPKPRESIGYYLHINLKFIVQLVLTIRY